MGRPFEHGAETRDRLLDAAGKLLATEGSDAVTVRRVATAANTTTRAVYSLFGGKQGLLSAMYRDACDIMVSYHESVPRSTDPVDEILPLALAYRAAALARPNLYGLIFERAIPGFTPTRADGDYARRSLVRVHEAVSRAVDEGAFGRRDAWAVSHELWALVHGLASLELQGRLGSSEAAEAAWRDAIPTFLVGLRAQAQRRPRGS